MSARKIGLLLLILGFGSAVEGLWTVRSHVDIGAAGCRVLGGRFNGPSFSFTETKSLEVPSPARVEIANGFGTVSVVEGAAGPAEVSLRKVVFLRTEGEAREFAGRIVLESSLDGSTLRLGTNRGSLERTDSAIGFETHFEVKVPPGTSVKVDNDHGAVDVVGVAAAEVAGSYEPVSVERVAGDARVSGRHGDVSVSGVAGSLTLSSRFGDAKVHDVKGPSRIEVEHGDATTEGTGHLSLDIKHGDATVGTVGGDLELRGEHAGARIESVSGRATVTTSYRDVQLRDVGSDARVTVDHGGLEARNVKGALQAEVSFGDASVESVSGAVDLKADHSGVRGKDLLGGARIRASGDDVTLEGFRGPVDVEVRRGSVELTPAGPLTDAVTVSTFNGGVRLEVPKGSRFELLATSSHGEIDANVPGLSVKEKGPSRVSATLGEGQARVTLTADQGDVVLAPIEETAER
jgi:DUF4097 and DUF4098 domain-containing protein YvlB